VHALEHLDAAGLPSAALKARLSAYGVVTLHRPSNVDNRQTLAGIAEALSGIAEHLPLVFPVHPRTRHNLDRFGIALGPGIVATPPLSYRDFLNLWKDARAIFTDSGGLQEETTALGIPCVTLRENTERPITLTEGTNILVGSDPAAIRAAAQAILAGRGKAGRVPERWDGRAAERIVEVLAGWFD
jgi:UDP-N-acetylglucosamine 2-epimerase (non-hydrolysing)